MDLQLPHACVYPTEQDKTKVNKAYSESVCMHKLKETLRSMTLVLLQAVTNLSDVLQQRHMGGQHLHCISTP